MQNPICSALNTDSKIKIGIDKSTGTKDLFPEVITYKVRPSDSSIARAVHALVQTQVS